MASLTNSVIKIIRYFQKCWELENRGLGVGPTEKPINYLFICSKIWLFSITGLFLNNRPHAFSYKHLPQIGLLKKLNLFSIRWKGFWTEAIFIRFYKNNIKP